MTREEIVEEVATKINSKLTSYNPIKEIIEVSNELTDYVIAHEQDTLKEFVEWYKKVLIKDHEDKVKQHEKAIMSKSFTDEAYRRGRVDEVRSLIDLLDSDLAKFLEEKNDGK